MEMKACLGLVKILGILEFDSFNVNVSVLGKGPAATNEVAEWSTALKGPVMLIVKRPFLRECRTLCDCDARPNLRRMDQRMELITVAKQKQAVHRCMDPAGGCDIPWCAEPF